jgi:hypothetical protein
LHNPVVSRARKVQQKNFSSSSASSPIRGERSAPAYYILWREGPAAPFMPCGINDCGGSPRAIFIFWLHSACSVTTKRGGIRALFFGFMTISRRSCFLGFMFWSRCNKFAYKYKSECVVDIRSARALTAVL